MDKCKTDKNGRSHLNPRESNMLCKCEKIFSHINIAYCFRGDLVAISLFRRSNELITSDQTQETNTFYQVLRLVLGTK